MALPAGVQVGQGQGVPTEYEEIVPIYAENYPKGMVQPMAGGATSAKRGTALKYGSVDGSVDIGGTSDVKMAGILAQDVYDPTGLPSNVGKNIFADGVLRSGPTGIPTSAWKLAKLKVTNVHGTVATGDFVGPYTGGLLQSVAAGTVTNGNIICTKGNNSVAGAPIEIFVNLA